MSAVCLISLLSLVSCTYSITMVHSQGYASDVVDETATNSPTSTLEIPVKAL